MVVSIFVVDLGAAIWSLAAESYQWHLEMWDNVTVILYSFCSALFLVLLLLPLSEIKDLLWDTVRGCGHFLFAPLLPEVEHVQAGLLSKATGLQETNHPLCVLKVQKQVACTPAVLTSDPHWKPWEFLPQRRKMSKPHGFLHTALHIVSLAKELRRETLSHTVLILHFSLPNYSHSCSFFSFLSLSTRMHNIWG